MKDALVKLQSLNEALGSDKMEMAKLINQMEGERNSLGNEKQELQFEKETIKEELIRLEQERLDAEAEKTSLSQNLG